MLSKERSQGESCWVIGTAYENLTQQERTGTVDFMSRTTDERGILGMYRERELTGSERLNELTRQIVARTDGRRRE